MTTAWPTRRSKACGPSGQFQVNTLTANAQSEPSVGMDSVGNFTIVWASKGQNLSYFNSIEGQRFDRYGNRLGGEVTVDTEATQGTEEPFVAVSHDGAIAVAWSQTIDPNAYLGGISSWSVMAKVFDPQGNVLMNQFSVGGAGGGTIAFDSADNFVVGYDTLTTNDDTSAVPRRRICHRVPTLWGQRQRQRRRHPSDVPDQQREL